MDSGQSQPQRFRRWLCERLGIGSVVKAGLIVITVFVNRCAHILNIYTHNKPTYRPKRQLITTYSVYIVLKIMHPSGYLYSNLNIGYTCCNGVLTSLLNDVKTIC